MSNKSNINNRSSVNLLPTYFQTEKNKNFLASTIDELYKVPVLQRIDGYVGSKLTPTYNPSKDVYIDDRDITSFRQKYQFSNILDTKNHLGFQGIFIVYVWFRSLPVYRRRLGGALAATSGAVLAVAATSTTGLLCLDIILCLTGDIFVIRPSEFLF